MTRLKALMLGFIVMVTALIVVPIVSPVFALPTTTSEPIGICTFVPSVCQAITGSKTGPLNATTAYNFLRTRINTVISIVFLVIILLGVFVVVRAGVQYIRSQGKDEEIGKAQKAISSVFLGIGAMFVGIVGIVLVLAFFGGTGLFDVNSDLNSDKILNPDATTNGSGGTGLVCTSPAVVCPVQANINNGQPYCSDAAGTCG